MPSSRPTRSLADAHDLAASAGFAPGPDDGDPDQVGLELEWLVFPHADARATAAHATVDAARVRAAAGTQGPAPDLAPGPASGAITGRITYEPGGQIELSSPPGPSVGAALETTAADAARLRRRLDAAGLRPVALGLDPVRPRRRVLDTPRYRAMAEYFERTGTAGRSMMCATASLQVNVGLGRGEEVARRWQRAHDLGPVLAATFANSPLCGNRPSGWHSTRLAVWHAIDATRTAPAHPASGTTEPGPAWARYALDAHVMLIRADGECVVPQAPLTFAEWVVDGHPAGRAGADDLAYHLTTLFPPVRPRGWLELRMLDALPDPTWRVAAAVTAALVLDAAPPDALADAVAPTRERWLDAARSGLRTRAFRDAALACFDRALDRLPAHDVDDDTIAAVREHRDRAVARGRTPADDRIDAWTRAGELVPRPEELAWT
jgi:glutamate--cysteine ligase